MKRLITLAVSLFLATQMFGSHLKGADIYYTSLGNNNYEITLTLYRGIGSINMPPTNPIQLINTATGAQQTISLAQDTFYNVSYCSWAVEAWVYKSLVSITAIPSSGIIARYSSCCRAGGTDNVLNVSSSYLTVQAELFPHSSGSPNSSPRFYETPFNAYAGKVNVMNTAIMNHDPEDSVHVELVSTLGFNGNALNYNPGYSSTLPFGNNTPVSIDPSTGLLTITNPTIGASVISLKASSYINGQLKGSSMRDIPIIVYPLQDSIPTISINSLTTTGTASISGNSMYVTMQAYDTLGFNITGLVNSLDTLNLSGIGAIFGNTAGTTGNCTGTSCASLSSTSFTGITVVSANFSFAPDSTIFPAGLNKVNKTVNLRVTRNSSCGGVITVPFAVNITINKPGSIWAIQPSAICSGDTTQATIMGDTTNLIWIPSVGVSDPLSGSPMLYPATTTKYTVVNLNDSTQIDVTVNVDTIAPASLIDNSTWVELPNLSDYDQVVWYYNGIPLAANVDSFAMPWPGDYYANVLQGSCSAFSDTAIKVNKNMVPTFGSGSGNVVSTDGWAEFEFSLNGNHTNTLNSISVALPDSGTYKTGTEPWFMLTDANQTIVATGTASEVSTGFYSLTGLNVTINPNETHKLFMDLYAGPTVFAAPASMPYTEQSGLITIQSAKYEDGGVVKNGAYPAVVFGVASGIGLVEADEAEVIAYPNPATDRLFVKVYKPTQVTLLSATGKVLYKGEIEKNGEIDLSNLARGVYILETDQHGKIRQQKVIKQ